MSFLTLGWSLVVHSPVRDPKKPQEVLGNFGLWTGLMMKLPGASGCVELTFLGLMTVPAKTVCGHGFPSTRGGGVARVSPFGMDLHSAVYCARFSQRVDLLCPCWGPSSHLAPALISAYPPRAEFRGAWEHGVWGLEPWGPHQPLTALALALCTQPWQ